MHRTLALIKTFEKKLLIILYSLSVKESAWCISVRCLEFTIFPTQWRMVSLFKLCCLKGLSKIGVMIIARVIFFHLLG